MWSMKKKIKNFPLGLWNFSIARFFAFALHGQH